MKVRTYQIKAPARRPGICQQSEGDINIAIFYESLTVLFNIQRFF